MSTTLSCCDHDLPEDTVRQAIERGIVHEGKMYNFDFDFFSSDRLVCTEVVYRSYDGLEGESSFELNERAGRKTLVCRGSARLRTRMAGPFEPVAIFGVESCETEILYGDGVRERLLASFDANSSPQ